jgi:hypothetical protein
LKRFTIIRRVKSVSDQKTKRGGAAIVRLSSNNGQSRAALEGQQGVYFVEKPCFGRERGRVRARNRRARRSF